MPILAVLGLLISVQGWATETIRVSHGHTILPGTWEWDLEHNALASCTPDFWWERYSEQESHLIAVPGVKVAVIADKGFGAVDHDFLKSFKFPEKNPEFTNKNDDLGLKPGTVLAVKTSRGNLAKVVVHGYFSSHATSLENAEVLAPYIKILLSRPELKNYHIDLEWELYQKTGGDEQPSPQLTLWKNECSPAPNEAPVLHPSSSPAPESYEIKGPKLRNRL